MNYNQTKELYSTQFDLPIEQIEIQLVYGFLCINDVIIMPIVTSKTFDKSRTIEIEDETSLILGEIYFLANQNHLINAMPEVLYKIYVCENIDTNIGSHLEYRFKYDYLLLNKDKSENYFNVYKQNSAFWGDYYHIENEITRGLEYNKGLSKLTAINTSASLVSASKNIHVDLISETNCFHRFLKYYHLLEMYFDMHTARKITSLLSQTGKEKEISKLLRDYDRDDIKRLESLIENYINPTIIENSLKEIFNYMDYAKDIFYTFGKTSNPLTKFKDLENIRHNGNFSENSLRNYRGSNNHDRFLVKIATYWIYRIRSSIAHRKLGEYIMDEKDIKFIVNFAEPLIKNIYRDFTIEFSRC